MIVRKNISDQVYDYLVNEIKEGRLKPGEKLPTERALSEKLGVSRVPIREAIRSLSRMGVLTTRQGDGTFVNAKNPDVLSKAMDIYMQLDDKLVIEFMEVRKIMESEAARLASINATDEDIIKISEINEQRKRIVEASDGDFDYHKLYEYDRQFHFAIAEATHNSVFMNFLDAIRTTLKIQQEGSSTPVKSNAYHQKIVEAIIARDPDGASKAMADHLNAVTESIMRTIGKRST